MNNKNNSVMNIRNRSVIFFILFFSLSGCVTHEYIANGDNLIKERVVDTKEASMARLKLALEYLRAGNTEQAKLNLDRAAKLNENIDGVYASYAFFYQHVGELVLADKSYIKALSQFPENDNTRNNYGAFLCDNHRYDEAEEQFTIAVQSPLNTQIANSYENAGLCAIRDKNWKRAKNHLTKVLSYEAVRVRAILGLIKVNIELNDIVLAKQYLHDYQRVYNQTSQSLWLAIQIKYKEKDAAGADKLGVSLLKEYPDSKASKLYLAKSLK